MNKKMYFKVLGFATFCLLSVVLLIFLVLNGKTSKPAESTILDERLQGERYNILIMGTDKDEIRADVMMICSVDEKEKSVNVMSVPRDTRVFVDNKYYKLNEILGPGGDEAVISEIKELTGIKIHDYVKVNFKAVEDVIDALGGVEFDVPQDMDYEDPYQDLYIHLKAGKQKLSGEDALKLLRFRQYPMGDLQRIQVQQDFVRELVKQKANIWSLFKVKGVYKAATDNMTTTLTAGDVSGLAFGLLGIKTENIKNFECPYNFSQSGIYVIIDKEKLDTVVNENFK